LKLSQKEMVLDLASKIWLYINKHPALVTNYEISYDLFAFNRNIDMGS